MVPEGDTISMLTSPRNGACKVMVSSMCSTKLMPDFMLMGIFAGLATEKMNFFFLFRSRL